MRTGQERMSKSALIWQLLATATRLLCEKETLMRANEALRIERAELQRRYDVVFRYLESISHG